ncbi:MAG TPA: acyl carrier protein [Mycobacteriales bacterium]
MSTEEQIRDVLAQHASLAVDATTVSAHDNLYSLGMTSHASVRVMLALEDAFDVEIPDSYLRKETFESVASIGELLRAICPVAS